MSSPESNSLLFSTKSIFEAIPELPVLYRFLGQEDLSILRLALLGPTESEAQAEFKKEKNKAEFLSYYVLSQWEDTNTQEFEVDTPALSGRLIQKVSRPDTHEDVFNRLYHILYPALGIPESDIIITNVSRSYLEPKLLGTDKFKGADYYAVSFFSGR